MKTVEFEEGLRDLERVAGEKISAFFCAKKLFWQCHWRFITDALEKKGWEVLHVVEKGRVMKGQV